MTDTILFRLEDGLAHITLNRPHKLNALNGDMFAELSQHLDKITPDQVGCVLIDAAGRSFCAGHDLDDIADGSEGHAILRMETLLLERLANLPMPVVAAVQGHCMTGGLEFVLAADIIIAADTAQFADTHAKWDLVPVWGL